MTETPRDLPPRPSLDRPHTRRRAVRILLLAAERVLLLEDSDPGLPGVRWWTTPGGGIDPGETPLQAGARELLEETGLRVEPEQLIGPVANRWVVHGFTDKILDQHEAFYVVRTDLFEVDPAGQTPSEQASLLSWRWWPVAELGATEEWIWPDNLGELIALANRGEGWPLELGRQTHESTVAVAGTNDQPAGT